MDTREIAESAKAQARSTELVLIALLHTLQAAGKAPVVARAFELAALTADAMESGIAAGTIDDATISDGQAVRANIAAMADSVLGKAQPSRAA